MRDSDVRSALHSLLIKEHAEDLDSTLFVDELGLCGEVRVDVAVVNAALSGFELKSAADTLRRLPTQIEVYSRVLDYCTIVVAECHLDRAVAMLPPWWGCIAARWDGESVALEVLSTPELNPCIDGYALAQLLWREEALAALESLSAAKGFRSKPRNLLWQRLADVTVVDDLRSVVREQLKARRRWRVDSSSIQSGRALAANDAVCRL
ncbi:sce7726 family protein [Mycobacteriaceae bacterium NPDC060252]